jgi:AraC-like DNA-binding protein
VVGYLNEAAAASVTSGEKAPLVSGLLLAGIALLRQIIDEASPSQDLDPLVERARHFVTTHLTHQDLGVGWIADRVRCNADHLSHRFRQVTGETLLSLITERRMEVATLLLRQSSEGVAQVARSCGYRDPAYFSRVFRKRFGQSPREWRKAQALSA